MKDLEDNKAILILYKIYALSKKYYCNKSTIKKIDINYKESIKFLISFFEYLTDNNDKVKESLYKYIDLSYFTKKIDGIVFEKNNIVSKIIVPYFDNIYSTSIGVHEYTHSLNFDKVVDINNIISYEEILPFLNQFLFLEFVNKKYNTEEIISSSKKFMLNEQLLLSVKSFISNNDENNKCINESKLRECYKYIIGSLYSLSLYEYYNMDKNMFMVEYKKLYSGESRVEDLLKYYDINMKNNENIILVKSLINSLNSF